MKIQTRRVGFNPTDYVYYPIIKSINSLASFISSQHIKHCKCLSILRTTIVMDNMYSLVLFLVVFTSSSLVSCSSSGNEQADIFMVVDDQTSTSTGRTKVGVNPVQIGRFEIGDGKLLTLSRLVKHERNCIDIYQPCGALDWCCEGLRCTGIIEGECRNDAFCHGKGDSCDPIHPCCQPNTCDGFISGTCV
ncbi:hypothetical protein QVD17_14784 [Tagetes erecta]|uniref:Uncharacterized protein n=1 Tax=Tagetes erecta TaxID=13708 RepID=A0AAD8KUQ0_TARER|nr:hypothetical protein QVD17_14784 [Tagetes erecta]